MHLARVSKGLGVQTACLEVRAKNEGRDVTLQTGGKQGPAEGSGGGAGV